VPVSRGGANDESNWITTSMLRNAAKANFTLDELGWQRVSVDQTFGWDGLMNWFVEFIESDPLMLADDLYLSKWYRAAKAIMPI
jgi:hypothetical protein